MSNSKLTLESSDKLVALIREDLGVVLDYSDCIAVVDARGRVGLDGSDVPDLIAALVRAAERQAELEANWFASGKPRERTPGMAAIDDQILAEGRDSQNAQQGLTE